MASPPLRIVFLTQAASWGGTEVNMLGLARALARRGHDVVIAELEHQTYGAVQEPGWTLAHVALSAPYSAVGLPEWRRILKSLRPDLCVLVKAGHTAMRSLSLDLAVRLTARRYLIMENHPAHPIPRPRRGWVRRLLPVPGPRRALEWTRAAIHHRTAQGVLAVSETVRRRLVADYAASHTRVAVIHAGVDVQAFRFDAARRAAQRRAWGLPDDAFVFGTVGRLAWVKRLDRLVDAFAATYREVARPLRLLIAGEGPERERLRQRAAASGLEALVQFPGFVRQAADLMCTLDGFVMTSEAEGLGMALLEAMACERPSIAVACGGPEEILRDATLGWLVSADVSAVSDAMRAMLAADAATLAAMGRRARAHVVGHFDAAAQFERIAEAVERA